MQLVLRRSQKTTGIMSKSVSFCLDARVDLNSDEAANVRKYGLGSQVLYNSTNAQHHIERFKDSAAAGPRGLLSAAASLAMAKMSLSITTDSLTKGQHIECKDLDELLGAENAIQSACRTIRSYIDLATTFDGREIVIDIEQMATA